ncbi:hypothetical protein, partial [Pyramidobacter piscolens]|uniref:hypothetical protein n=1 Tax=Pyramidobacter piscolens TaxID=638849 RepID=UPI003F65E52A
IERADHGNDRAAGRRRALTGARIESLLALPPQHLEQVAPSRARELKDPIPYPARLEQASRPHGRAN